MNDTIPSDLINIPNFICHRRDRNDGRRGGGICCYVKTELPCRRLDDLESDLVESIWLIYRSSKMPRFASHLAIGVYYHPPDGNKRSTLNHIIESMDHISRTHPYCKIILMGDFNNLPESEILSYPLKQVVTKSTRKANILDKIFTDVNDWYEPVMTMPPVGGSDHNCVLYRPKLTRPQSSLNTAPRTKLVRSIDHSSKVLLAHALKNFNWVHLFKMDDCDDMVQYFYDVINQLLDFFLPMVNIRCNANNKPWITEGLLSLIRQRQHAWQNGNSEEYHRLRNRVQRTVKLLKSNYYNKCISNLRNGNPRKWWTNIKKLTGQASQCTLTGLANNVCNGDMSTLVNGINNHLQSVSADLVPLLFNANIVYDTDSDSGYLDSYIIEPCEVERRLSSIDIHKSSGPDNIPNWFLRDFSVWLAEPLSAIFNASVRTGVVPTLWKQANVIPIPKVTPPTSIESDLRPISLTPTVSKILESFVGHWIMEIVADSLDPLQFGGIKGRSTTHVLVDLLHSWHQALDQCKLVRVLFIDYSKAFDHIDHNIFISKLRNLFNIPQFIINWMTSFLTGRRQRVKLGDIVSEWLNLNGGLPQGSFLAPLVFIMFINDLHTIYPAHKYIDDVTVSEIIDRSSNSKMSTALHVIDDYSDDNHMTINAKKTKVMGVCPIGSSKHEPLYLKNNQIEDVTSFKLLGVHIDNDLKFSTHVQFICSRANTRLHFLKHLKRNFVDIDDSIHFYFTVVRPVLEYACPAWHCTLTLEQSHAIELIQKRALSILFGSFVFEDYDQFCTANGIETLESRRETLSNIFFEKQVVDKNSPIHHLIEQYCNKQPLSSLRRPSPFNIPTCRTSRFKNSYIISSLSKYITSSC